MLLPVSAPGKQSQRWRRLQLIFCLVAMLSSGRVSREEKESGGQTILIFGICLLFVYLLLSAQYESLLLPFPVILSLPAGVFGAYFCAAVGRNRQQYLCTGGFGDADRSVG